MTNKKNFACISELIISSQHVFVLLFNLKKMLIFHIFHHLEIYYARQHQSDLQKTVEKQTKELESCLLRILHLEARIEIMEIDKQMQEYTWKATRREQLNQLFLELRDIYDTNRKIQPGASTKLCSLKRSRSV